MRDQNASFPEFTYWRSLDALYHTQDAAARLQTIKRVRLCRRASVVDLSPELFQPLLKLAVDFDNYGGETRCQFVPGVAVLLGGGDEPEYVLICCFKCHDIHVVRRPSADHPKRLTGLATMSPELESTIFELTRASYPNDEELQSFQLEKRVRAKRPYEKHAD